MSDSKCGSTGDTAMDLRTRKLVQFVKENRLEDLMDYFAVQSSRFAKEETPKDANEWKRVTDACVIAAIAEDKAVILKFLITFQSDLYRNCWHIYKRHNKRINYMKDPSHIVEFCLEELVDKPNTVETFHNGIELLTKAFERGDEKFINMTWNLLQEVNQYAIEKDRWRPIHDLIFSEYATNPESPFKNPREADQRLPLVERVLEFLVQKGQNVNALDRTYETTPLHIAGEYGDIKCIRMLLKHGADVFARNGEDETVWETVCQIGRSNIIPGLLDEVAFTKDSLKVEEFLFQACSKGLDTVVQGLLERGVDVNCLDKKKQTPLMAACIQFREDVVGVLLKDTNIDVTLVDAEGNSALRHCLTLGGTTITADLLQHMLNRPPREPDIWMNQALLCLLFFTCPHQTNSALSEIIQGYRRAGINLNSPDGVGRTLFMSLSVEAMGSYGELLLNTGVDVNALARDGYSALANVANWTPSNHEQDHDKATRALKILLANNIDMRLSQHQFKGNTPLQAAFAHRQASMCSLLLEADCSLHKIKDSVIDMQDTEDLSVEFEAIRNRILQICDEPQPLKTQARLCVLRTLGQCDLKKAIVRLYEERYLPKVIVDYVGKTINLDIK